MRSPRERSPDRTGLPITSGLWFGVPLKARSDPSTGLIGKPLRSETSPFTCQPFAAARKIPLPAVIRGSSQSQEIEAICLAWKSDGPYCDLRLNKFGTAAPSAIADALSSERENV